MPNTIISHLDVLIPFGSALFFLFCGVINIGSLLRPIMINDPKRRDNHLKVTFIMSLLVFLSLCVCFYKFTVDDAYISLRFARNFANGYGLVYSTDGSMPVEGYTNFLWVLLETPLFILKLSDTVVLHSIKLMGIAFGMGIIVITYLLIRLVTNNDAIGLLGTLLLSAIPQLSFWGIGGLETTMYIFLMLIGLYAYIIEQRKNKMHILSMFFFLLMALTRPEGLFLVIVILLWEFVSLCLTSNKIERSKRIKYLLPGVFLFLSFYGVYFVWRYSYYGFLLTNTFYAKSGSIGLNQILSRLFEMRPFITYMLPFAALAWFGYLRAPIKDQEKNFLTTVLLALVAFGFASKSEWMPGFRYELPFVPILILFSSVGIYQILTINIDGKIGHWKSKITNLGVLFFLGMFLLYPTVGLQIRRTYTDKLNRAHITLGKWLKQYAPKDASYASWDMGAVPYYSQLPLIIEIHPEGLLSTYITHKGYDVNYLLSLKPSFIVLPEDITGENEGMYSFYRNGEFKQNYQLIFSFAFRKDYILAVHKHREIVIEPSALDEGKRLAEKSFAAAK